MSYLVITERLPLLCVSDPIGPHASDSLYFILLAPRLEVAERRPTRSSLFERGQGLCEHRSVATHAARFLKDAFARHADLARRLSVEMGSDRARRRTHKRHP